MNLYQWW